MVIYVPIKIDVLPIKMNLCQALINYIVMCQLPSVQGNRCESSDHSSTVLSCSVLSSSPGLTEVLVYIHIAGKVPNRNMSCPQEDLQIKSEGQTTAVPDLFSSLCAVKVQLIQRRFDSEMRRESIVCAEFSNKR